MTVLQPPAPPAPPAPPDAPRPAAPRRRPFQRPRAAGPDAIREAGPTNAVAVRERRYRQNLLAADILTSTVALLLSTSVLDGSTPGVAILLGIPVVVLASKLHGLYGRDELVIRKSTIDEAPALFQRAMLFTVLVWMFDDTVVGAPMGTGQAVVLLVCLWGFGLLLRALARRQAARGAPTERLLGIGDTQTYRRLSAKLQLSGVDATLVGSITLDQATIDGQERPCERTLRDLVRVLDVHRVLIFPGRSDTQMTLDLVRAVKSIGVRVSIVPRVLDVVGNAVVFDDIAGMTVLGVRRFELSRTSLAVKRGFDLACSLAALIALAPLLAVVAVAIKLDSPGPALFRQERVGRGGRRFRIAKFRTMVQDAEQRKPEVAALNDAADGLFKITGDPRITRVGRLLRSSCVDELPQLLNVVRGEMSLVGPRPLIVAEDSTISGYDRRRLHMTPGMTGHWQIMGSSRVPLHEMVKIDYLYITTWSLFQDIKILLRTVAYVASRPGI